ncbi:hypothetical protein V6N13_025040 [Hibiscus sabdariffa]|uniref:Uncharacterized protein n=1 Tax=Hibiscus sabdariffa TaxID=183260 RepID=A0ABR2BB69_9ROSI
MWLQEDDGFQPTILRDSDGRNHGICLEKHSSDSGNQIKRDQLGDFCLTQSRAIYGQNQSFDMEIQMVLDVEENHLDQPEGHKRSRTHLSTLVVSAASDSTIVCRKSSNSPLLSSSADLHK